MSRLQKEIQRLESGDDFGDPEERVSWTNDFTVRFAVIFY